MKESGCLVPMWPVKNLIEKSFVHGWLVKVVQALHPLTVMAIAPLFRQICCGCAVHTQCCSTGELLGHSLHLGTRHILQCSICCSFSLWQRCAFLHVKMQKCSFLSHQLLIAVIKRDMQAQQSSAALGASASLSWAEDCQPDGSTHFVSHQKGWTSLSSRNVSCAYLSSQDLPLQVGSPRPGDGTAVQVMQQPHSLRLFAVKSEQYRQENEGRSRNWSKTNLFFPHWVNFNLDPLADQILCEAAQTFLLAQGKQQEGAGTWRDRKGNKGIWQNCWLLTTQSAHGTIMQCGTYQEIAWT